MQKLLIISVLVVCFVPLLLASRKSEFNSRKNHAKSGQNEGRNCTVIGYGPCTFKGDAQCGVGKKEVKYADDSCSTQQKSMKCKVSCGHRGGSSQPGSEKMSHKKPKEDSRACQYQSPKKSTSVSACDPETRQQSVTLALTRGNPQLCPPTKIIYKKCKGRSIRAAGGRRSGKGKTTTVAATTPLEVVELEPTLPGPAATPAPVPSGSCKYRKGTKGECDVATGTRSITKQLKKNSPSSCPATKTETKPCKQKKAKPTRPTRTNKKKTNRPDREQ